MNTYRWNNIRTKWMTHLEFVHFLLLLGKDRNYEVRTGKVERQKSWDLPYLALPGITYEKFSYILVKGKSLETYLFEPWEGIGRTIIKEYHLSIGGSYNLDLGTFFYCLFWKLCVHLLNNTKELKALISNNRLVK